MTELVQRDGYDEPLFPSAHAALMFAHWFSHQAGPAPTAHAKLMRGPVGSGKGLAGIDGAGQAGMILAEVSAMSPVMQAVIAARFAPCFSPEYRASLVSLIPHAAAQLGTGISNRRLIADLVQRYFGVKVTHADLADRHGVDERTIKAKYRPIRDRLREDEAKADAEICGRLHDAGISP